MDKFLNSYILVEEEFEKAKNEYEEVIKIRQERNEGEKGVPVYLILDDLTDDSKEDIRSGDSMFNLFLTISALNYLCFHKEEADLDITPGDISIILGALAEKYFTFLSYGNWQ